MARARKSSGSSNITQDQAQRRHLQLVQKAAAFAGVPEAQRGANDIELVRAPQVENHPTPVRHTVRRLTAIEKLERAGVLERHHKAACEWYANAHELGFMTSCRTSNFEGASGGGCSTAELLIGHDNQRIARDDYHWGRTFIPTMYLALFERLIIGGEKLTAVATGSFTQKRTRAREKTVHALQLCASRLFDGIKAQLPIDLAACASPAAPRPKVAGPASERETPRVPKLVAAVQLRPICDALSLTVDQATLQGMNIAEIRVAPFTLAMIEKERGGAVSALWGIPVVAWPSFRWGYTLVQRDEAGDEPIAA
jgi:hypothetical protein